MLSCNFRFAYLSYCWQHFPIFSKNISKGAGNFRLFAFMLVLPPQGLEKRKMNGEEENFASSALKYYNIDLPNVWHFSLNLFMMIRSHP